MSKSRISQQWNLLALHLPQDQQYNSYLELTISKPFEVFIVEFVLVIEVHTLIRNESLRFQMMYFRRIKAVNSFNSVCHLGPK